MATKARGSGGRPVWATPSRWPVRWRIAAVSASLTLLILLIFAAVIGRLVSDRMEDDFRNELAASASELAAGTVIRGTFEGRSLNFVGDISQRVTTGEMALIDGQGTVLRDRETTAALETFPPGVEPGPPSLKPERVGDYEVVARQVPSTAFGPPVFVAYGRSRDSLEETIGRLWLFLAGGVFGGTILAFLAGMAVAGRAMRPIKDLTRTARKIASTRDPSERVPMPAADDEISELAKTLDQMLHELDASRNETEQLAQAQREFVADASHELRTPLTSILANLELLQERLAKEGRNGEEAEIVEGALHSSKRMRRLVADLLLLARADAGRAGVRSDCDLAAIVGSALVEVRPVAGDHELIVAPTEPTPVKGNPDDLHRLVVNLLENGIRHTPPETRIHVDLRREDHTAILDVVDDGPGIPPGMEEQVFSRFVRGTGPADTNTDGGTGLGLAIVQAVATSHGGSVEAGQAPHGGARFTVRLPLAERVGAEAPTPVQAPA
jgi:two-component system, OmpR family, sensor kinase